jgi:hypothetical protein
VNYPNTSQFDWQKSLGHQLFLATFLTPRLPENHLVSINWEWSLQESPTEALERFMQAGVIIRCRLYHLLISRFATHELKDLAAHRSLPSSDLGNNLPNQLVQTDAGGMWREVAAKRQQKISDVAKLLQCSNHGQQLAMQFVTNLPNTTKKYNRATIEVINKVLNPLFQTKLISRSYDSNIKQWRFETNLPLFDEPPLPHPLPSLRSHIIGKNSNERNTLPRRFEWEESREHLIFLTTFLKSRHPDDHPTDLNWEWALGETPAKALERFMQDGVVVRCSRTQLFADHFDIRELEEMSRNRGLTVSDQKNILISQLIQVDELGLWKEVALREHKKISDIVNFVQSSKLGQQISEQFLHQLETEFDHLREETAELAEKVIIWLLGASGIFLTINLNRKLKRLVRDMPEPEGFPEPEKPIPPPTVPMPQQQEPSPEPKTPAPTPSRPVRETSEEDKMPTKPEQGQLEPKTPALDLELSSAQTELSLSNTSNITPLFRPMQTLKLLRSGEFTIKDLLKRSLQKPISTIQLDATSLGFLDALLMRYLRIFSPIGTFVGLALFCSMIWFGFNLLLLPVLYLYAGISNITWADIGSFLLTLVLTVVSLALADIINSSERARILAGLGATLLFIFLWFIYPAQVILFFQGLVIYVIMITLFLIFFPALREFVFYIFADWFVFGPEWMRTLAIWLVGQEEVIEYENAMLKQ